MDFISTALDSLSAFIFAAAGNPLSYLMIFLFCAIDGFFPPVPSESLVVALASLVPTHGNPNPWLLGVAAGLGAFVGDNVAYLLGRAIGTDKFAWMRRKRLQHAFAWAGYELRLRPVSLILVARFVPIGRVAVNLVAGSHGLRAPDVYHPDMLLQPRLGSLFGAGRGAGGPMVQGTPSARDGGGSGRGHRPGDPHRPDRVAGQRKYLAAQIAETRRLASLPCGKQKTAVAPVSWVLPRFFFPSPPPESIR